MAADHYATLGVGRDASPDEIKRAYRRLARAHHPDANHHDADAEERFKEVTRAYEVLSDPSKRQRYDLFGEERSAGVGFQDFGGISDLFSAFFGGGATGGARRSGPARGSDILATVELTLEEVAEGVDRDVEVTTFAACTECDGTGAAPGTRPSRCMECGGAGEVRQVRRTMFGNVMTASACPRCRGTGEEVLTPCPSCSGTGRVRVTDTLSLHIPAGIDDGERLRVSGRGEAGTRGGGAGDLYVEARVLPHEVFQRVGADLGCEVAVPMTVAALGGTIEVPTLDGAEEVDIEPGTQPGEIKRFRNRGLPRLDGRGRGELVALLRVETPRELDDEQAELLSRLARLRGEAAGQRGLFDKLRGAFK